MLDHGMVIDDANVFNQKLQEWEDFYNFHRPHGGLDGQTPYERLRQKTTPTRASPSFVSRTRPFEPREGIEPLTYALRVRCSAD